MMAAAVRYLPETGRGSGHFDLLDWAITDAAPEWGVTALSAVAEMDAGPVWASRSFPLPAEPPRKTVLYAGPVTDAAVELVREVVEKASRPLRTQDVDFLRRTAAVADLSRRPTRQAGPQAQRHGTALPARAADPRPGPPRISSLAAGASSSARPGYRPAPLVPPTSASCRDRCRRRGVSCSPWSRTASAS
jgi:hypothetical protein